MFPHTTFFFFSREEQHSFYLKLNDVTPSTNFLVCSKCVIGDSQQDRNARAYFLVKQTKQKKKRRQSNNSTIQKSKQKRKINEKTSDCLHKKHKQLTKEEGMFLNYHHVFFLSTVESVIFFTTGNKLKQTQRSTS